MLIEKMKKEKQLDSFHDLSVSEGVDAATPKISPNNDDWQDDDDDDMSVGSAEENWCIVSDDDVKEKDKQAPTPKGNCWWDEEHDTAEESFPSFTEKMKELNLYEKLPPTLQNPKNLLLFLHLLVGLFVVIHLAWDRYSWRSSAMHLEQELRILKTEPIIAKQVPPVLDKEPPLYDDDDGFSEWNKEKTPIIMDNCWIKARASVSLQECAEDAKDTLQDMTTEMVKTAKTFAKHTWKAAKKFKKHVTAAAAAEAARRRNQPY